MATKSFIDLIPTATDAIVAPGKADIGEASLVEDVPEQTVQLALMEIRSRFERVVDQRHHLKHTAQYRDEVN